MIKILVIDDDRIIRRSVSDALAIAGGFDVEAAEDGFEGLEMARDNPPDLIVCDVEMPRLNGYEVVAELQKDDQTARIPFIFLTGRGDRVSMRHGMTLGADDYISKPFKINELLQAVNTRLAKRERIEEHFEEKLESLRGNILSAVPHELRTPLTLIIGYGDVLSLQAKTLPPKQIQSLAKSIVSYGKRLHHLVENYIIYAQIELILTEPERVNKMRLYREAQPDRIIQSVAQTLAEKHGRSAQTTLSTPNAILPITKNNFEKIVEELVDNAFKFSEPETAVTITTAIQNQTFMMQVRDQGRGMTEEQIANIGVYMQFERKIQEQQGSGVGLMLAKRLTELYGGQLTISSTPGQTTCITVKLPA